MTSASIGWKVLHPLKLGSLSLLGILVCPPVVLAQIQPDRTLGNEQSTLVNRDFRGGNATVIEGGAERGSNLFHSFQEFNVNDGERVYFANPDGVENIFSRVTGTRRSAIRGTLGVDGAANLFLLNPNGILFGPNATLDLRGSFLSTTADRINFLDGTHFSAVNSEAAPLLTVSVPVGLQFGNNPRPIINQSMGQVLDELGNPLRDPDNDPATGLRVLPNETLALVGGTVRLTGGGLIAGGDAGGRIELGSVAGAGFVSLTPIANGWRLGYEDAANLGDIQLSQSTILSFGASGGVIHLQAREIKLNESGIFSVTQGEQVGGSLTLNALESIFLTGTSIVETQTRSRNDNAGNAGNVSISTQRLTLRDQNGAGPSTIGSITSGRGQGGDVSINVADAVTIINGLLLAQTELLNSGAGPAGNLTVTTNYLRLLEGGAITTTTFGAGRAGDLTVQAEVVEASGIARFENGKPIIAETGLPFPSGLYTSSSPLDPTSNGPLPTGDGGGLTLTTRRLTLSDGALLYTGTLGFGDAGDLVVNAESIEVSGVSTGQFPTSLATFSGGLPGARSGEVRRATGQGGNLTINTENLTVRDGALVAVNSINPAGRGAGRIQINAQRIQLDNGQINATTESGSGANIRLDNVDLLLLRRNSQITTSAGLETGGGTGGNIDILRTGFIVASPSENSDITANAIRENAGNVTINEQGIIGITPQTRQTAQSDITATSTFASSGVISTTNPVTDPTQGVVTLPGNFVDASGLIAQGCNGREGDVSRFVATGRGGLPLNPDQPLQARSPLTPEWVTLNSELEGETDNLVSQEPEQREASNLEENAIEPVRTTYPETHSEIQPEIVEADGWVINANGEVTLIASSNSAALVQSQMQGYCLSN